MDILFNLDLESLSPKKENQVNPSTDALPDSFTPPLHMHATREPELLKGSPPVSLREDRHNKVCLRKVLHSHGKRKSWSRTRSLEDEDDEVNIDMDIVTDRIGCLGDLDINDSKEIVQRVLHKRCFSLPSITERLSEETLDDCYAFTEVAWAEHLGQPNTPHLAPLVESDDEDEYEHEDENEHDGEGQNYRKLFDRKANRLAPFLFIRELLKDVIDSHNHWKDQAAPLTRT